MTSGRYSAVQRLRGFCVHSARYLIALLRDVLALLWKILVELVAAAPAVWAWWQMRQQPEQTGRTEEWCRSAREQRANRWASWRALTLARRVEIGCAALLLAGLAAGLLRARSPVQPHFPEQAATYLEAGIGAEQQFPTIPSFDLPAAASRMHSEIAQAPAGQWVFL